MSSPTYQSIGFIQDKSDFDLIEAHRRLQERFVRIGGEVILSGRRITVTVDGWRLGLEFNERAYVINESRDCAENYADCPRASEIAQCHRRVELWSEDDDWEMEHINDYILACEIVGSFQGIILFDTQSGELI